MNPAIFTPHEYQIKVLQAKTRVILASAGVQAGKTLVGAAWLLKLIQENNFEGTYLIAAPTYKILSQSTLPKFFELAGGQTAIGKYRKADQEIDLTGGKGKIYIRSCEEPDHLEGMTISGGAWLDEGGQVKQLVWINILGRTAIARAPILITTSPYILNWVYKEIVKREMEGGKNITVVQWKSIDNPHFSKEEYEERRNTMSEAEFARRYMGEWRQASGLVFPDFSLTEHVIHPIPVDPKWKIYCGVDFGFHPNPTVFLWVAISETGDYYVIDSFSDTRKTTTEIVEIVRFKPYFYQTKAFHCDPQGVENINELIYCGIHNAYGRKQLRKIGLEKMIGLIRTKKLHIFTGCKELIDEMERYHLKESNREGVADETPVKADDHFIDALRYVIDNTLLQEAYVLQPTKKEDGEWTYEKYKRDQVEAGERMKKFESVGQKRGKSDEIPIIKIPIGGHR